MNDYHNLQHIIDDVKHNPPFFYTFLMHSEWIFPAWDPFRIFLLKIRKKNGP